MPDLSATSWSEADASNSQPPPNGWPEGQPPSTVNDCARMMAGRPNRLTVRLIIEIDRQMDDRHAAGLKDAMHLAQRGRIVRNVLQRVARQDTGNAACLERQRGQILALDAGCRLYVNRQILVSKLLYGFPHVGPRNVRTGIKAKARTGLKLAQRQFVPIH